MEMWILMLGCKGLRLTYKEVLDSESPPQVKFTVLFK